MRLTSFYLISALGLSIGLVEIRHEKEHRKQERLVSEMLYLTDQNIQQAESLLYHLKEYIGYGKKLNRHKEAEWNALRDKYEILSSLHMEYQSKTKIEDQGVKPIVINHVYTTLKDADALLKRMNAIYRREYKPREMTRPIPIVRDAQLQYPVGNPIPGKLDMFLPTHDELEFSQVIVDGNIIANPMFPLHVPQKSNDIELTIRNPVTREETVFRNIEK